MAVDSLAIDDPRVEHRNAEVRGKTYHYIQGNPSGTPVGTVVLIHGFPDLSHGWRFQVPVLLSLNYRVIVPDMLGYGRTSSPEDLNEFGMKSMCADIAALARQIVGEDGRIILGGHDWGGAFVWRFALYHPELLQGLFGVCTPYAPPRKEYHDLRDVIAAGRMKNFGYQLHLRGPEVEAYLNTEERVHQFLLGMHGGRTTDGSHIFSPEAGVLFDNLAKVGPSPLVPMEIVDYYAKEYMRTGMRGPLNWYRTAKINFDDELPLAEKGAVTISAPTLFIVAMNDAVLLPSLSIGMEKLFTSDFKRVEVKANHWALWEASEEVNVALKEWLEGQQAKDKAKASL